MKQSNEGQFFKLIFQGASPRNFIFIFRTQVSDDACGLLFKTKFITRPHDLENFETIITFVCEQRFSWVAGDFSA